jgi:hypothetical protein
VVKPVTAACRFYTSRQDARGMQNFARYRLLDN